MFVIAVYKNVKLIISIKNTYKTLNLCNKKKYTNEP